MILTGFIDISGEALILIDVQLAIAGALLSVKLIGTGFLRVSCFTLIAAKAILREDILVTSFLLTDLASITCTSLYFSLR